MAQSHVRQPTGQSKGAFLFALTGQVADIVTTEVALSQGLVEGNPLVRRRAVRIPLKLGLPFLAYALTHKAPRAQANTSAIIIGVCGWGPAAWNIVVTVRHRE